MLTYAEALARLKTIVNQMPVDELRVLLCIAERIEKGRDRYGKLTLRTDARDHAREALEEAADGLAYAAMALLRSGAIRL